MKGTDKMLALAELKLKRKSQVTSNATLRKQWERESATSERVKRGDLSEEVT